SLCTRPPPVSPLFPYTTLFRSCIVHYNRSQTCCGQPAFNAGFLDDSRAVAKKFVRDFSKDECVVMPSASCAGFIRNYMPGLFERSEEHTSELQSRENLVCRLLL